jgi:hypothetical protein
MISATLGPPVPLDDCKVKMADVTWLLSSVCARTLSSQNVS